MSGPAIDLEDGERAEPESSLATKIILLVFVSTFVSAAAVSWISIETARRQLWSQIHRAYPAAGERTAQRLLRWLASGRGLTADLASRSASAETLRTLLHDAAVPARRAAAHALFRSLVGPVAERSREIADFALLDPDGRPIFASGAFGALSLVQRAALARADAPLVQALAQSSGTPLIVTSVPLAASGASAVAYLVGRFRPDGLRDTLATDRFDEATRIDLLDGAGRLLVHAGLPDERGDPATRFSALPFDTVREYTGAGDEHVVGSARALGALGWTLLVETPYEHAFAPVLAVLQRLLLIDVGVVAVASLLAYAVASSMLRPIEALSEGARQIAAGRLDLALPENGRQDELGLLTRTFNQMVRRLRRSQADLESANRQLRDQNQSLQASNEVLEQLSITDGLTKLHNHRFFQDHLTREIKRVSRTGEPLAILLVDIDDFKRLNDRLGHAAGDELLQRVACVLAESVRDSDLLARYGGEEFAIIASATELAGAAVLAEKLRSAVAQQPIALEDSVRRVTVTVSVGVAEYKGDRKKFFQSADRALYRAKADGKNCVRVAE